MPSLMEEAAALGSVLSEDQILRIWLDHAGLKQATDLRSLHYAADWFDLNYDQAEADRNSIDKGACYRICADGSIYTVSGGCAIAVNRGDWALWLNEQWHRVPKEKNLELRSMVLKILLRRFTQRVLDYEAILLT